MLMRILAILGVLVGCISFSSAQGILSWQDCARKAKETHPDLLAAKEKITQSVLSKTIATGNFFPQIGASLGVNTSRGAGNIWNNNYSLGLSARQLLFDGFKTPANLNIASNNIALAEYDYLVTSSNLRLRLKNAFINLLRSQELLKITEEIAKRLSQNAEMVRLRYEGGQENRGSLLAAQANLAQADFEVKQSKRQLKLAQRRLNKELGNRENLALQVTGSFDDIKTPIDQTPVFEEIAQTNPLLKELIIRKDNARLNLKSSQSSYYPSVYASASYGKSDPFWLPENESLSGGASLSIGLFQGGSTRANVAQNKSVLRQTEYGQLSSRDQVILTLEDSWYSLQDSIEQILIQRRFLEADSMRSQIAQAQYSSGLLSFDSWIIIENNLVNSKKAFLNTRVNSLIAEANWIQAKGGTLDYEE